MAVEQDSAQPDAWAGRLCPECGLCCNGVLFADVRLVKADNPSALESAGLALVRRQGRRCFPQPCSCFDGRLCGIYADRPSRCRGFDCHTLKQVQNGQLGLSQALRRVREVQRLAERVRRLLRALGQQDETLALTHRYRRVMEQPIHLTEGNGPVEWRGELMLAVGELMERAHREFLQTD